MTSRRKSQVVALSIAALAACWGAQARDIMVTVKNKAAVVAAAVWINGSERVTGKRLSVGLHETKVVTGGQVELFEWVLSEAGTKTGWGWVMVKDCLLWVGEGGTKTLTVTVKGTSLHTKCETERTY